MKRRNNISTGAIVSMPLDAPKGAVPRSSALPIFTPLSNKVYSSPVIVEVGQAIVIDLYNMPGLPYEIYTNRVSLGHIDTPTGESCTPCGTQKHIGNRFEADVLFRQRMNLACPQEWIFNQGKTQMIIAIPGAYEFELSSEDLLYRDLQMEYRILSNIEFLIPKEYQGGIPVVCGE